MMLSKRNNKEQSIKTKKTPSPEVIDLSRYKKSFPISKKNRSQKLKVFLNDHWRLLFKSAAENHLHFQSCKKNPDGSIECSILFDSYTSLKNYQKRLRRATLSASTMVGLVVVSTLVVQLILPVFKSKAANYEWVQASWQTKDDTKVAEHNSTDSKPQANWAYYSDKSDGIAATSTGVQIASPDVTTTASTGAAFSLGSMADTTVSGNSVVLDKSFVQINGDGNAIFGLKSDGTVYEWGYGLGSTVPRKVDGLKDIVSVGMQVAVDKYGKVWTWGTYGGLGTLGNGSTDGIATSVAASISGSGPLASVNAKRVVNGIAHGIIDDQGRLWSWGSNYNNQLALATNDYSPHATPTQGTALNGIVLKEMSCYNVCVAVDTSGKVYSWGYTNNYYVLGDGTNVSNYTPQNLSDDQVNDPLYGVNIVTVSVTGRMTVGAIDSNGNVWMWGNQNYGKIGDGVNGSGSSVTKPKNISALSGSPLAGKQMVSIVSTDGHTVAMDSNGELWVWGGNYSGGLGIPTSVIMKTWPYNLSVDSENLNPSSPLRGKKIVYASAMDQSSFVFLSDGTAYAFGDNYNGELGINSKTNTYNPTRMFSWQDSDYFSYGAAVPAANPTAPMLVDSDKSSFIIKSNGTLWAWGSNYWGQLGVGDTASRQVLTQVTQGGITNASLIAVSGGSDWINSDGATVSHTLALDAGGNVWAWGRNNTGQLGNNSTTNSSTPIQLPRSAFGNVSIVSVHASWGSSYAIDANGDLWAWGYNYYGQLGNNTTTDSWVPINISALVSFSNPINGKDLKQISCYNSHCNAVDAGGKLYGWGYASNYKMLGNGSTTNSLIPIDISILYPSGIGAENVTSVATNSYGALATDATGKVWVWGSDSYGNLCDGMYSSFSTPTSISGAGKNLNGKVIVSIAARSNHTLLLDNGGNVWACGYNNYAQLGFGDTTNRSYPEKIPTFANVKAISVGNQWSHVLKGDGSLWGFGYNYSGTIGNSSTLSTGQITRAFAGPPVGYFNPGGGYKSLGAYDQPTLNLAQKIKDNSVSFSWNETLNGGTTSVGFQVASDSAAGDFPNTTTTPAKVGEKLLGIGGTNPDSSYIPYIVQLPSGNWRMYYTSTASGYPRLAYRDTNNADYPNVDQTTSNVSSEKLLNLGGASNNQAYGATVIPKMSGGNVTGYRMYYSYHDGIHWRLAYRDTQDIGSTSTVNESLLPPQNDGGSGNNLEASAHIINPGLPSGETEYTTEIVDAGGGKYRLYFTYIGTDTYHQLAYYETSTSDGSLPNETNIVSGTRKLFDTPSVTNKRYGPRIVRLQNGYYRMYFTYLNDETPAYWRLAYRDTTNTSVPQENGSNLEATIHLLNTGSSSTDQALGVFVQKIGNGGAYRMYYAYQNNGYWQLAYKDVWNFFGPDGQQHADCNGTNYCYKDGATVGGTPVCSKTGSVVTCTKANAIHNGATKLRYRAILATTSGVYSSSVNTTNFTYQTYDDLGPKVLHHMDGTPGSSIANYSTFTDASGHNNATLAYNANGNIFGYTAHTGNLTGLGQYTTLDGDDSLQIPLPNSNIYTSFSIESWFNASATQGTIAALNSGGIGGPGIGICTSGKTGIEACNVNTFVGNIVDKGTIKVTLSTDETYSDGQWHHGALTYDGSTLKLYVDGVLKKSTALNYALTGLVSYAKIGAGTGNHWGGYIGKLDELAIYDRALALSDIQAHYAGGTPLSIRPDAILTSSVYNTLQDSNVMKAFKVFGAVPAGTSMRMQVRGGTTATPDAINWTKWCGLASCDDVDAILFTNADVVAGQSFPLVDPNHPLRNDLSKNKQYFQYRILMASDGQNSPAIDGSDTAKGIHVTYEVNGAPKIQNLGNTSQDSNGIVQIGDFDALDDDIGTQDLQLYFTADVGATLGADIMRTTTDNIALGGVAENLPYNRAFMLQIDQEQMSCTRTKGQSQLNLCTRGINNTTAASHTNGATVWVVGSDNVTEGDQLAAEGGRSGNTWNIVGDLNQDGIYIESARIRIVANDLQTANQVSLAAGATSNTFTLDTKKPNVNSNTSVIIDARRTGSLLENQATLKLNVSDDTNIRYKYSRTLDQAGEIVSDSQNGDSGIWLPAGTKILTDLEKVIKLSPANTINTDTVYVQFIDDRNNKSDVLTVNVPERPTAMMIQDITNTRTEPDEVGLFVTWKTFENADIFDRYFVERAMIANPDTNAVPASSDYTKKSEITSKAENYYRDNNVPYDESTKQHYYYRIYTQDKYGNISYYSSPESDENIVLQGIPNGTQDGDEGGGGPAAEPKIENVNLSIFATGQATLTWTSDQVSDSTVEYSATPGAYNIIVNVPTMIKAGKTHSVTLKNLDPTKKYYYRVKSTNGANSTGTKEDELNFNFQVQDGISMVGNPMIEEVTNSTVTIVWKTNASSYSTVYYSDQKDSDNMAALYNEQFVENETRVTTPDSEGQYEHRVTVAGLAEDKNYYFWVASNSMAPIRTAANKNTISGFDEYFSFRTTADHAAPKLSNSDVLLITDEKAVFNWYFNENAQVTLHYKPEDGVAQSKDFAPYSKSGVLVVDTLSPKEEYSYWLTATDKNSNTKDYGSEGSPLGTFTTLEKQVTHLPLAAIQSNVLTATQTNAVIAASSQGTGLIPTLSANAKLCYGAAPIASMDCANPRTSNTGATTHVFTIPSLTAGTTYHYRISAEDSENASNIVTTDDATFTTATVDLGDVTPPQKQGDPIVETFPTKANITVTADDDSLVFIEYKKDDTTDFETLHLDQASKNEYKLTHTVTLTNLDQDKTYYFRVRFQDRKGNISMDNTFYQFQTKRGPQISKVTCQPDKNKLTFSWETDENADTYVIYSEHDDMTGYFRKGKDDAVKNHDMAVDGLLPITTYSYQIASKNAAGGVSISDTKTCQTLTGEVDSLAPSITDVKYVFVGDKQALINWMTLTELSTSQVEYEKTDSKPSVYAQSSQLNSDMVSTHTVLLENLSPNSTYHYRVVSRDSAGNTEKSDDYTFKTLADNLGDDTLGMIIGKSSSAPAISAASAVVSRAEGNAIVITWKTDKESSSLVAFKPEGSDAYQEQGNSAEMVTEHSVTLHDLAPNTTYTYFVKSIDALGNVGQSETGSFTTAASSTMFNVQVVDISYDSATVSWETALSMTTQVEYGEGRDFNQETGEDTNKTKAHAVTLTGLKAGTTYNYRLKGKDAGGNPTTSSEYAFQTPAPPAVQEFKVDSITENTIKVAFSTNIETSAFVTLTNTEDDGDVHTQGDPNFNTEHSIEVPMLASGVTYELSVEVRDEKGNAATKKIDDYTTAKDENAPKIDQIKSDTALTQNDKVQAIISWTTDEPANAYLIYREGRNGAKNEVKIDDTYALKHTAISTSFKPGTPYFFNVKSVDKSGNVAISSDYALLTPKKKQNIIQIIINNFQDIFGWARR